LLRKENKMVKIVIPKYSAPEIRSQITQDRAREGKAQRRRTGSANARRSNTAIGVRDSEVGPNFREAVLIDRGLGESMIREEQLYL
jgi:hypothetical protein